MQTHVDGDHAIETVASRAALIDAPAAGTLFAETARPPWRALVVALWLALLALATYVYFAHRDLLEAEIAGAFAVSTLVGSTVYVISSCVRGFTLIPVTFLLVAALPFFPPVPLYLMTMLGIAVSAATLYRFSHLLGIDRLLERRHPAQLERIREVLARRQFAIVVGWSFFPFVPTDLICCACGSLRTGFRPFLAAVLVGEGVICAAYVFLGDRLLMLLQLR